MSSLSGSIIVHKDFIFENFFIYMFEMIKGGLKIVAFFCYDSTPPQEDIELVYTVRVHFFLKAELNPGIKGTESRDLCVLVFFIK